MTASILLPNGATVLFDERDEETVRRYRWRVVMSPSPYRPSFYARGSRAGDRSQPLMHKLLTGWALVDHMNGDGLDNRRANLREATRSQNMGNRCKGGAGTSSRYKGVSLHTTLRRWVANIGYAGSRKRYLGLFGDEIEAALAYDAAARGQWGEYAALNFPGPGERSALTGNIEDATGGPAPIG